MILLRLASTLQNETSEVNIIPEFPIPKTTFATDSGEQSFSGVVDYQDAGTWSITPTIIEAKKDRLTLAVPQATVAVASYCKQHMYFFFLWTFRTS